MNREEALRALDISKSHFAAGRREAALKFAKKSLSLEVTSEAQGWLKTVERAMADSSNTSQSEESLRHRGKSSTSKSRPEEAADTSSRPYSQEQVDGIRRVKASKAKGDLYAVLGLQKGCSDADIKKAYRKLALQYHPDKCSAPEADDAFKAIGHAFATLSDPKKREHYDAFGMESSDRSSSFASERRSRYDSSTYERELTPEEIFNLFFGDSGIPPSMFTAGPGFRRAFRQHQRSRQHERDTEGSGWMQIVQLIPLLILLIFSLASSFSSEPDHVPFSFSRTYQHTMMRTTPRHKVTHYVSPQTFRSFYDRAPEKLKTLDESVELQYKRILQVNCANEREMKRIKIMQAKGWFGIDEAKLSEAENMRLNSCETLVKFANV